MDDSGLHDTFPSNAPPAPRRALLALTALVLALHWLALASVPLEAADAPPPQGRAFHTRMIAQAAPEAPAAPPPPAAPRARAPAHPPTPKPRPRPPEAAAEAVPETASEKTSATTPDTTPDVALDATPAPPPALPAPQPGEAASSSAAARTADEADSTPEAPPEPPPPPSPETTAAEPPAAPPAENTDSATNAANAATAGVDIQPPGAANTPAGDGPPPVRLPPSARLNFEVRGEVKGFHYRAGAELLWRQDGAHYEARQQISAFLLGSRSQTSVGSITPQGLQPERFGDKARREQAAHFNFETHEVIFSANTPRAAIGAGAQDRHSVFIQLGAMLAAAPERYPAGTRITLTTVGARHADRWSFIVEGAQTLDLPAGPTPALKLQRLPQGEHDQRAELWLGSALNYLPVRIRLTQGNGDFAELSLSSHELP